MTLILSAVTSIYTLQVSDRLVTKGGQEHDELANKSLFFAGKDCVVSMAYTGLAYLDGKRTDDFIAECMQPICSRDNDGAIYQGQYNPKISKCYNLGNAIKIIKDSLESLKDRNFIRYNFELTICGWLGYWKKRKKPRPCLIKLSKRRNSNEIIINHYVPRYWCYKPSGVFFNDSPKGYISLNDFVNIKDRLDRIPWGNDDVHIDITKKILISLIQKAASETPLVGPDCMIILLPHPALVENGMDAVISFNPLETRFSKVGDGVDKDKDYPVIYTPWSIGSNSFYSPSKIMGTGSISWKAGGTYKIRTDFSKEPIPDGDITFSMTGSERKDSA